MLAAGLMAGCGAQQSYRVGGFEELSEDTSPPLYPGRPQDLAIIEANKRVADAPDDPDSHVQLGNAYLARGWPMLASRAYQAAVELAPGDAPAVNNLGLSQLRENDLDSAEDSFLAAIELDPFLADAHYNLATIYEQQGMFEPAILHYRIALTGVPELADPSLNPNARASDLLLAAEISLYQDRMAARALGPLPPAESASSGLEMAPPQKPAGTKAP
jgi:tetratricopeptide (TPR) repeat protein